MVIYGGRCEAWRFIPASLERRQGYRPDVETLCGDTQINYDTGLLWIKLNYI